MPARCCVHQHARHSRTAVLYLVGLSALLAWAQLTDAGDLAEPPAWYEDESLGYQYEGKVEFARAARRAVPKAKFEPAARHTAPVEHRTVLIKRDGSKYSKRLPVHDFEEPVQLAMATSFPGKIPEAPEPWEGERATNVSTARRRLLQRNGQIVISSTNNDLSCEGCDTTDTRQQVNPTTNYPFTALGQLLGQLPGSSNQYLECSGTLIGARHVITAAHCVYDINDSHQYVNALDFSPALNGKNAPFGTLAWETVRVLDQFTSQTSYTATAMNFDFALITLKDSASSATGYLAMFSPPSSGTRTVDITTAGYPGEKPAGTMWQSSCSSIKFDYSGAGPPAFSNIAQCSTGGCANIVQHHCLSSDGQSGSGMYDASFSVRAILSGKVATSDGSDYNVGTQIDPFVYNTIAQWYNEDGGDNGNATLPLTPSPGTPGAPRKSSGISNLSISTPWVVAVIAAGGGLLVVAIVVWIWTCCQRNRQQAKRAKAAAHPRSTAGLWPQGGNQQFTQSRPPQAPSYGPPHHNPAYGTGSRQQGGGGGGSHPQGVVYDDRSGQFLVNGQPYGHYPYGR